MTCFVITDASISAGVWLWEALHPWSWSLHVLDLNFQQKSDFVRCLRRAGIQSGLSDEELVISGGPSDVGSESVSNSPKVPKVGWVGDSPGQSLSSV